MKKFLLLFMVLMFLSACGEEASNYTIVEQDVNTEAGKSTVRIYTEDLSEENIEAIISELLQEDFFGVHSIHAWIHEPPTEELPDYGALAATAKYANTNEGKAQVGIEELGETFVEFVSEK